MTGKLKLVSRILLLCLLLSACSFGTQNETQQNDDPSVPTRPASAPTVPTHPDAPETIPTDPSAVQTDPFHESLPSGPAHRPDDPPQTVPVTPDDPIIPTFPGIDEQEGVDLAFQSTGKKRIAYTVKISAAHYVSSPAQLPGYPEFEEYDDEWFRDHALVLVYETVSSGTLSVNIAGITAQDGVAAVELSHHAQNGIGTADMTTWLLWAEVDTDLSYTWTVKNPALDPDVSDR